MKKLEIYLVDSQGRSLTNFNGFLGYTATLKSSTGAVVSTQTGIVVADKPSKFKIDQDGDVLLEISTSIGQKEPDDPIGHQEGLAGFNMCVLGSIPDPANPQIEAAKFKVPPPPDGTLPPPPPAPQPDFALVMKQKVSMADPGSFNICIAPIDPQDFELDGDPVKNFNDAKAILQLLPDALVKWGNLDGASVPQEPGAALQKLKRAVRVFARPQSVRKGLDVRTLDQEDIIPIDTACVTCNSLYNTPGTAYFRNTTWYMNCLINPQCT